MSKLEGTDFNKESAFKHATQIAKTLKTIEEGEDFEAIVAKSERISAAMEIDLNSLYDSLNIVIDMIDDPQARKIIEDIRDEIYRAMR
jgi:hypothetical protein